MEVKLGEYVIDVDIVRKNNKNVYFRFKDDTLVVTAHRLISEREIKRMIQENESSLLNMFTNGLLPNPYLMYTGLLTFSDEAIIFLFSILATAS